MHSNSIWANTNSHHRSRSFIYKKGLSLRSLQYSYLHLIFYSIQWDFNQILIRKQSHKHNKHTLPGGKKGFFSTIIFWKIQIAQKGCLLSVWKISHTNITFSNITFEKIYHGVDKHSLACQHIRRLKLLSVQNLGITYAFLSA